MAKTPTPAAKPAPAPKAKAAKLEKFANPEDFSRAVKQGPLGPVERKSESELIAEAAKAD